MSKLMSPRERHPNILVSTRVNRPPVLPLPSGAPPPVALYSTSIFVKAPTLMQVSVPGTYQKPAPYRLQTFTYSTGLALTGRSAACAPATATRPAAEPRRRLFTIFIVTSKFPYRGRVPLVGCRSILEGPLPFPAKRPRPLFPIPAMRNSEPGAGDLGMPPPVARATLIKGPAQTTEKPPNHRLKRLFPGGCCTNGTHILRAAMGLRANTRSLPVE